MMFLNNIYLTVWDSLQCNGIFVWGIGCESVPWNVQWGEPAFCLSMILTSSHTKPRFTRLTQTAPGCLFNIIIGYKFVIWAGSTDWLILSLQCKCVEIFFNLIWILIIKNRKFSWSVLIKQKAIWQKNSPIQIWCVLGFLPSVLYLACWAHGAQRRQRPHVTILINLPLTPHRRTTFQLIPNCLNSFCKLLKIPQ